MSRTIEERAAAAARNAADLLREYLDELGEFGGTGYTFRDGVDLANDVLYWGTLTRWQGELDPQVLLGLAVHVN